MQIIKDSFPYPKKESARNPTRFRTNYVFLYSDNQNTYNYDKTGNATRCP